MGKRLGVLVHEENVIEVKLFVSLPVGAIGFTGVRVALLHREQDKRGMQTQRVSECARVCVRVRV